MSMRRIGPIAGVIVAALLVACGDPVTFSLRVSRYSSDDIALTVNGEPFETGPLRVEFSSYEQAEQRPFVVESWSADGLLDSLTVHPGMCGDTCVPPLAAIGSESLSLCLCVGGDIRYGSLDCARPGSEAFSECHVDMFCEPGHDEPCDP